MDATEKNAWHRYTSVSLSLPWEGAGAAARGDEHAQLPSDFRSKYYFPLKEPGLLGEKAESRAGKEKVQAEFELNCARRKQMCPENDREMIS